MTALSAAAAARVAARFDGDLDASSSASVDGAVAASESGFNTDDLGNMWKG